MAKSAYKFSWGGKTEEERSLKGPGRRWKDNIKMELRYKEGIRRMHWAGSVYSHMAGCFVNVLMK